MEKQEPEDRAETVAWDKQKIDEVRQKEENEEETKKWEKGKEKEKKSS